MNSLQRKIRNDAPIVPGSSAAGLSLGDDIGDDYLSGLAEVLIKLEFGAVTIWTNSNLIEQIRVGAGYQGLLLNKIGIGSTLSEVETAFQSSVLEDEEDNLVVSGVLGLSFETEAWKAGTVKDNLESRITDIFVFRR